jgi:hypothetical protein
MHFILNSDTDSCFIISWLTCHNRPTARTPVLVSINKENFGEEIHHYPVFTYQIVAYYSMLVLEAGKKSCHNRYMYRQRCHEIFALKKLT